MFSLQVLYSSRRSLPCERPFTCLPHVPESARNLQRFLQLPYAEAIPPSGLFLQEKATLCDLENGCIHSETAREPSGAPAEASVVTVPCRSLASLPSPRAACLTFSATRRTAASRLALFLVPLTLILGCTASLVSGTSVAHTTPISTPAPPPDPLSLAPATAILQAWQTIQFTVTGADDAAACTWSTSNPSVLSSLGEGQFQGRQVGNATVSVACGALTAQAVVTVVPQAISGPIVITTGGTYSGNWNSDSPGTPAVTIATDEPVTIEDSILTSRGPLIRIDGPAGGAGAHVTIDNVTATALDPGIEGLERGAFVSATNIASLVVRNCTLTGASFGIYVAGSTVSTLQVLNNLAFNLEDRASDGQGGLLAARPQLGHFVLLANLVAPQGAEIGWNKIVQTMGRSSVEDVINIFRTQGAPGQPVWVHDNYIEGNSSPSAPTNYTGTGIIADGGTAEPVTAYALFENNSVVHTAGSGVVIDNGHDVTVTGNRIVSCGQDASGAWFAMNYANATSIWDSYASGPSLFFNDTVTASAGGLVIPNAQGKPAAADFWGSALSMTYPGNSASGNDFTNPCLSTYASTGSLNFAAEDAERAYWIAKAAAAGELIGDQHQ
jgi:nitrous oxidase accessory protein NosD